MRLYKIVSLFIYLTSALFVAMPIFAAEPHPQSHEAIKKMADELEAARKAREADQANKNDNKQHETSDTQTTGSGPITKAELEKLKQQCDEAREKYLAPLRKSAVEECIANKVKSPEECEKFYHDLGESGITEQGNFRQRRFHNIPQCQPYYEAERKYRMNIK